LKTVELDPSLGIGEDTSDEHCHLEKEAGVRRHGCSLGGENQNATDNHGIVERNSNLDTPMPENTEDYLTAGRSRAEFNDRKNKTQEGATNDQELEEAAEEDSRDFEDTRKQEKFSGETEGTERGLDKTNSEDTVDGLTAPTSQPRPLLFEYQVLSKQVSGSKRGKFTTANILKQHTRVHR
jgi:hypothetical protein